jgi:ribonuclease H2 subunit C
MLAIKPKSQPLPTVTANILPCRIHHDGPINISERHWAPQFNAERPNANTQSNINPESIESSKQPAENPTVHFRGRRLHGREVAIPEGYTGAVVRVTKELAPKTSMEEDDGEEEVPSTCIAEQESTFDKIIVWKHEEVADGQEDQYVRGVEEWIGFAEAVSTNDFGVNALLTSGVRFMRSSERRPYFWIVTTRH